MIVDGERVELKDWRGIAADLNIKGDDLKLLEYHFDGLDTLRDKLNKVSDDLSSEWYKLYDRKRSSLARIYKGEVQYKTWYGKAIKAHIKQRSAKDTHTNDYLCFSAKSYLHKVAAYVVAKECGYKGFYNEFDMIAHHRFIGETGSIKGNSLENLTLLTVKDHTKLHAILKRIAKNIKRGSLQVELL